MSHEAKRREVLPEESIPPERHYARMKTGGRLKDIVAALFKEGMFPQYIQAMLEFVDNAINYRDINGQTQVIVTLDKNSAQFKSIREAGIDQQTIEKIFTLGESDEVGVGTKGVGMKFGAMALALDLLFEGKLPGSRIKYLVEAKGIGDTKIDYEGMLAIEPKPAFPHEVPYGMVIIGLNNMKWGKDAPPPSQFRRAIEEVYAPILISDDYRYSDNHKDSSTTRLKLSPKGVWEEANDKALVLVHASKKIVQAKPVEVPLRNESIIRPSVIWTSLNEPIGIEGGVLDTSNPLHKEIKPGIRIFYNGRMVERAIFPEDERSRDSRVRAGLYLRIHIDHIQDIKSVLQMNKSAGIVRESDQWKRIMEVTTKAAEPLINNILAQERRTNHAFSARFRDAISLGRKYADAAIRDMLAEGDIISSSVEDIAREETRAQERPGKPTGEKKPNSSTSSETPSKSKPDNTKGKSWEDQQPRTLSTANADPDINRRRRTPYHMRYAPLLSGRTSEIVVENRRTYLVINSEHPFLELYEGLSASNLPGVDLLASTAAAREQMYNLALEESEGDTTKFDRIYQAGLQKIGKIITQQTTWNSLQNYSRKK